MISWFTARIVKLRIILTMLSSPMSLWPELGGILTANLYTLSTNDLAPALGRNDLET